MKPRLERAPRRKGHPQQWTRLFFNGEPKPWHRGAAVYGLIVVAAWLFWIIAFPFFVAG